jgi:hypothetical protein
MKKKKLHKTRFNDFFFFFHQSQHLPYIWQPFDVCYLDIKRNGNLKGGFKSIFTEDKCVEEWKGAVEVMTIL